MFGSIGFKPNGGQMVDLESQIDFIMFARPMDLLKLTRRYPCIYSLYDLYYRGYLSLGGYILVNICILEMNLTKC